MIEDTTRLTHHIQGRRTSSRHLRGVQSRVKDAIEFLSWPLELNFASRPAVWLIWHHIKGTSYLHVAAAGTVYGS